MATTILRESCTHCVREVKATEFESLEAYLKFEATGLCQDCQSQL